MQSFLSVNSGVAYTNCFLLYCREYCALKVKAVYKHSVFEGQKQSKLIFRNVLMNHITFLIRLNVAFFLKR
jgi:hypothetical protein